MRVKIKSPSTSCLGKVQGFFTMSVNNPNENVSDHCRVCSFVFINIKRKRNLKGEFMKISKVFNQKVLPDDGPLRTIFDTCRYRIETSWKRNCNWEVTDLKKNGMPLSWRQLTLFPNPVGNCPKASLLPTRFSIVSFCSDFNSLTGNTAKLSLSACWRSSTNLTFSAILANLVKDFTTV